MFMIDSNKKFLIELEYQLIRIKTIKIMLSTDCYYLSEVITEQINYH